MRYLCRAALAKPTSAKTSTAPRSRASSQSSPLVLTALGTAASLPAAQSKGGIGEQCRLHQRLPETHMTSIAELPVMSSRHGVFEPAGEHSSEAAATAHRGRGWVEPPCRHPQQTVNTRNSAVAIWRRRC